MQPLFAYGMGLHVCVLCVCVCVRTGYCGSVAEWVEQDECVCVCVCL